MRRFVDSEGTSHSISRLFEISTAVYELFNGFDTKQHPASDANRFEPPRPNKFPQCCPRDLKCFANLRNRVGELRNVRKICIGLCQKAPSSVIHSCPRKIDDLSD